MLNLESCGMIGLLRYCWQSSQVRLKWWRAGEIHDIQLSEELTEQRIWLQGNQNLRFANAKLFSGMKMIYWLDLYCGSVLYRDGGRGTVRARQADNTDTPLSWWLPLSGYTHTSHLTPHTSHLTPHNSFCAPTNNCVCNEKIIKFN